MIAEVPNITLEKTESLQMRLRLIKIKKRRLELDEEEEKAKRAQRAQEVEWNKCAGNLAYFIRKYVKIYDNKQREWIDFDLWAEQEEVANLVLDNPQTIILKARQLGLTWLLLAVALWMMIFHPIAVILIFSLREIEAKYLLSKDRLKGMFKRLPMWMRPKIITDKDTEFALSNGSVARAFPTSAGDSYSATLVIVDEADLVPDLNGLLQSAKPTIDAGGKICLISRSDKEQPASDFKKIYRAAAEGKSSWKSAFLPWYVRPSRTKEWYEIQKADALETTGSLDNIYESYPATAAEALAPKELNKRISPRLLQKVYQAMKPLDTFSMELSDDVLNLPNLELYRLPEEGKKYFAGVDPAEGNPNSNDSSISVIDEDGEEVALLRGKFEPDVTADYAEKLCIFFNEANCLVERNNHGHSVLLSMRTRRVSVMFGNDKKPGWNETTKNKHLLYDNLAETVRTEDCVIHSTEVFVQIASIEGSTLSAPEGMLDDSSDSFALAILARDRSSEDDDTTVFSVF